MTPEQALAYLAGRRGLGIRPGVERVRRLLGVMGDPQDAYPVIHVAGTNGKTSTARIAAAIVTAHGLAAGEFTSPPLLAVEEQFAFGGIPMTAGELGAAVADVAPFVEAVEAGSPEVTEFEVLTAVAFSWFAERAANAAVIEAGLGGTDDATNVVGAEVAALTGVAADHVDVLGPTVAAIAAAKAGIVHDGAVLVSGVLPAAAEGPVAARVAETGATWRRFGADFRLDSVAQAVGGWLVDVDGVYDRYDEVYLPLHGRHQAANLAVAVVSVEELFGRALDPEAVRAGAAAARVAGRLEVVGAEPVVVLDVAHNPAGFAALADALAEEFLPTEWTVVFGARGARDPAAMLEPLRGMVDRLVVAAAVDPLAIDPAVLAAAGSAALAGVPVDLAASVPAAVTAALAAAPGGGGVLVAGSHAVVGEARAVLVGTE